MKKFIQVLITAVVGTIILLPFTHSKSIYGEEAVRIGVVSEYEEEVWKTVVKKAEAEGIKIEIVLFNDYVQPNVALADGSLDLNAFQHVEFLNEWNEANNGDLQALGYTYVAPLKIYSDKINSIEEVKEGDILAIPNDATNGGRALLAFEQAGLIEVDDKAGVLPTVKDITNNPKNIEFKELEAGQLVLVLPDVAAAAINNNFVIDAGLTEDQAIFNDAEEISKLSESYKNIIACRPEDKENPTFLKILDLYQSKETAEKLAEISDGADVPAWEAK